MGIFFGELIATITEGFLDLIGKSTLDTMPDIEYKNSFIVKYKGSQIFAKCIISIAIFVISIVCFVLTRHDAENSPLFIIFAVLGVITLLPSIYASQYKCTVDENTLIRYDMFKKRHIVGTILFVYARLKQQINAHRRLPYITKTENYFLTVTQI